MSNSFETHVLVVGAGPAGLATAQQLGERRIESTVIERGDDVGWVWANLYDSLKLHTGKHLSSLPGMPFRRNDPLFIRRERFVDYLHEYASKFRIDVRTGVEALTAKRGNGKWTVTTSDGEVHCRHLVVATGIVSNPITPEFEELDRFYGRVTHSVEYLRPDPYRDRRVLVVGVGNSGAEIASELANLAAEVTVVVRSGANIVPLTITGIPIQYIGYWLRKLPRFFQTLVVVMVRKVVELRRGKATLPRPDYGPLDAIPMIGFHLDDAIRAGKVKVAGAIERFTESGVVFSDGAEKELDDVILATGYRAALQFLGGTVSTDPHGFGSRRDRVRSTDAERLWFVGHNYDASGGLFNIRVDSALVADGIAADRNSG